MVDELVFRNVPKVDFHSHVPLAGRLTDVLTVLRDVDIPKPPQYAGLPELEAFITQYLTPHLKQRAFFEYAVQCGFQAAAKDGVAGVEITLSIAHRAKYGGSLPALTARVRAIAASVVPHCAVRIYAGLRREYGPHHFQPIVDDLKPESGFDGVDLTGDELSWPIDGYRDLFRTAARAGLRRKAHVGEQGSADDVLRAIEVLDLDAVQHGVAAADSKAVVRAIALARIPLHVSLESSAHIRNDRISDYGRFRELLDADVLVTIGTDDLLLFGRSISQQLADVTSSGFIDETAGLQLLSRSVSIWPEAQLTKRASSLSADECTTHRTHRESVALSTPASASAGATAEFDGDNVYRRTAHSYDSIAQEYAARHDSLGEIRDLLDRFASSLPASGVILDAGCGHGRDADYFTSLGFRVVGIDYSVGLLALAVKRAPKGRFAASDVRALPFRDEVFDGVWMNAVLHHLQVPHIINALCESRRVLKDGGKFYTSFHLSSREGWNKKYGEHRRFYSGASPETVAQELQRAGLSTTSKLTRSSDDRWLHWFAQRARVPNSEENSRGGKGS